MGAATVENSTEVSQKKKKYRATIWLSNSTPKKTKQNPKKTKTLIWKDTCTPTVTAALFTTAKIWKQPKHPLTDEWIKKMWYMYIYIHTHTYTHTMEYYSAIKKNDILLFAATWMDLEGIRLSEISQTKTNTVWYHLYVESKKYTKIVNITKKKQTHRYRELVVTSRGARGHIRVGEWKVQTIGYKIGSKIYCTMQGI